MKYTCTHFEYPGYRHVILKVWSRYVQSVTDMATPATNQTLHSSPNFSTAKNMLAISRLICSVLGVRLRGGWGRSKQGLFVISLSQYLWHYKTFVYCHPLPPYIVRYSELFRFKGLCCRNINYHHNIKHLRYFCPGVRPVSLTLWMYCTRWRSPPSVNLRLTPWPIRTFDDPTA